MAQTLDARHDAGKCPVRHHAGDRRVDIGPDDATPLTFHACDKHPHAVARTMKSGGLDPFVPGDLRAIDEPVGHTDVHEDPEGRDAGDGAVQNLSFLKLEDASSR